MDMFKKVVNSMAGQTATTLAFLAAACLALFFVAEQGLGESTWAGLALIWASTATCLFVEHYIQPRDAPYAQIFWRWTSMGITLGLVTVFIHTVFPGPGALHFAAIYAALQVLLVFTYIYLERKET